MQNYKEQHHIMLKNKVIKEVNEFNYVDSKTSKDRRSCMSMGSMIFQDNNDFNKGLIYFQEH